MTVFIFDVTVSTHDDLKLGIVALRLYGAQTAHHRITVEADSYADALASVGLLATRADRLVTGLYLRV